MNKLVGYRDGRLVVERDGSREAVVRDRYFIRDAFAYAEGQVFSNAPKATIYDNGGYQEFEFRMLALPDRDYKDVYAVLHLNTVEGQSIFLPQDLRPMKAGRAQWLHFRGTLSVKLDRSVFHVYLFSDGVELYQIPTERNLKAKKQKPIPARSRGSQDPILAMDPSKPLPRSLAEAVAGESATVSFLVSDKGYGYDFQALDAPSLLAEQVAVIVLKSTRYIPGAEDGFYEPKLKELRVAFDNRGRYRLEQPELGGFDEDLGF